MANELSGKCLINMKCGQVMFSLLLTSLSNHAEDVLHMYSIGQVWISQSCTALYMYAEDNGH